MLGAIASALGGAVMGAGETFLQDRLNTRAAREQRDWESSMYGSRYQMQVEDLKKAGLNPMLAYGQSPGSVPSGATASVSKPEIAARSNETRLATAQAAKINQETENLKSEKYNIEATQDKLNQEIARIGNEVMELDQKIKVGRATEDQIKLQQDLTRRQKELTELQIQLGKQEYNTKRPEEVASGTGAAQTTAHIERVLRPLIDAINAAIGQPYRRLPLKVK